MSDKKARKTEPIQVDAGIVAQIRAIVGHTGQNVSDLVTPLLREPIAKEYERVVREAAQRLEQERRKKH